MPGVSVPSHWSQAHSGLEPPDVCGFWAQKSDPRQEKYALIIAESSLQPYPDIFFCMTMCYLNHSPDNMLYSQ